jgi:hypothetical protein
LLFRHVPGPEMQRTSVFTNHRPSVFPIDMRVEGHFYEGKFSPTNGLQGARLLGKARPSVKILVTGCPGHCQIVIVSVQSSHNFERRQDRQSQSVGEAPQGRGIG